MAPRRFAISDIHGCAHTFHELLHRVLQIEKNDHVFLLGDYIDRGPSSKEVIDSIFRLRQEGYNLHPLRGNHEDMLIRACHDEQALELWIANGGGTTLSSFGISHPNDISLIYRTFFVSLPYYFALKEYVMLHAGLNFDLADPFEDSEAMLWSRANDINVERIQGRTLVCGHTPATQEEIRNSARTSRITIDNGCVYSGPGLGSLAAIELNTKTVYFQKNIDPLLDCGESFHRISFKTN